VSYPFTFRWEGNSGNNVVHVSVVDAAERAIFEFDARGDSAPAPHDLQSLRPGETFSWRVATAGPDGETGSATDWTPFSRVP
jgi:hypothetical protein